MTKVGSSVLQTAFLVIILLLTTFYLFYPKREGFINEFEMPLTNVYKTAPDGITGRDMDGRLGMFEASASDKNNLLLMRRCYQFPDETIDSFKKKFKYMLPNDNEGMYYIDFDMITCNFKDVESRIICELQKFRENVCPSSRGKSQRSCVGTPALTKWEKTAGCPTYMINTNPESSIECTSKIQGPVYALIFQAPYYRAYDNNEERVMTNQYHTDNYQMLPYNAFQDHDDSNVPLFIYVQLLFARYNKNGTYVPKVDFMNQYFVQEWDRMYFSREKQCYIQAIRDPHTFGGCATTDTPYKAICLGPSQPTVKNQTDEKTTPSSYGILYTLNHTHVSLRDLFGVTEMFTTSLTRPEVFLQKGNFKNVSEAEIACQAKNATLATTADVQNANFAGANWCEKGWTAQGHVVSSGQGTLPNCPQTRFSVKLPNADVQGAYCYGIRPSGTDASNVVSWNAQRNFTSKLNWLGQSANKIEQKCGTFDEKKYMEMYPEAKGSVNGFAHWANTGIDKGYNAYILERGYEDEDKGGVFDETAYKNIHMDIESNTSAKDHLKTNGWKENRRICIK